MKSTRLVTIDDEPSNEDVRCVGRGCADGCGYKGGKSGYACPECGGMLLSKSARKEAIKLAANWSTEEGRS
jgi:hypothetical protein